MRIKPLGDRVVLEKIKAEEVTASGILMPNASKERLEYALVVELSEKLEATAGYKKGDKVIYSQYSGTTVKDENLEYIVIKDEDVLGVIIEE